MKKLLLLFTLFSSSLIMSASDIYEVMDKFVEGEKKHKKECFDYEKDFMSAKFDLMKKQHEEMFNMKREALERLKREGFSESMLREKLAQKVAMCDRHLDEWKRLCDAYHDRGSEFYRRSKEMLKKFKDYAGVSGYSYGKYEEKSEKGGFLGSLEKILDSLRSDTGSYITDQAAA